MAPDFATAFLPPLSKRKGRRPIEEAAATKRQNQKRAAARAFRERREAYLHDLETRASKLQVVDAEENVALRGRLARLNLENATLQKNLAFFPAVATAANRQSREFIPQVELITNNNQIRWAEVPSEAAETLLPHFRKMMLAGSSRNSEPSYRPRYSCPSLLNGLGVDLAFQRIIATMFPPSPSFAATSPLTLPMRRDFTGGSQSVSPTLSSVTSNDYDDDIFSTPSSSSHAHQLPPRQSCEPSLAASPSGPREQQQDTAVRRQRERQRVATQACRERKMQRVRELEAYINKMVANGGFSDETRELLRRVQELERKNTALMLKLTKLTAAACVPSHPSLASNSSAMFGDICRNDAAALDLPNLWCADPLAFPVASDGAWSLMGGPGGINWNLGCQPLAGGQQWFF
ncbi:hypothetical protein HDU84_003117 [Entophlyctis sp. JEL0112]|nr:hypothetical protein HDU84_003117 [Entophlyctis sp. JEL0112]